MPTDRNPILSKCTAVSSATNDGSRGHTPNSNSKPVLSYRGPVVRHFYQDYTSTHLFSRHSQPCTERLSQLAKTSHATAFLLSKACPGGLSPFAVSSPGMNISGFVSSMLLQHREQRIPLQRLVPSCPLHAPPSRQ